MRIVTIALCCFMLSSTTALRAQKIDYNKTLGSSGPATEGQDVRQLPDGNLLIVSTQSTQAGSGFQADILLVKTKLNGDEIWSKTLGSTQMREYAQHMDIMPNGNIIICGHITDLAETRHDGLLMCVDPTGNLLWQKQFGKSGNYFINAVKVLNDGLITTGAYSTVANGNGDAWLMKTSLAGDSLWSKTFGGAEYDDSWDLELAPDGGFLITGGNYSFAQGTLDDAWIIKTDATGNEQWRKMYGLADRVDWAWAITTVKTNGLVTGYVFVGIKNTVEGGSTGDDLGDLHFVKVDLQGNVVWDKSITTPSGSNRKEGMDIKQLADGTFIIAGYKLPNSLDGRNVYVIKASAAGDVLWETTVGSTGEIYTPRAVTPTNDGGCVIVGSVFTPAPAQFVSMIKVGGLTADIKMMTAEDAGLHIYPNPAVNTVHIDKPAGMHIEKLELLDMTGKLLQQVSVDKNAAAQLNIANNIHGLVMLKVFTADAVITQKLVVQ